MASFSQPAFISSLVPIKNKNALAFSLDPKNFVTFKNSKISSSNTESPQSSEENSPQSEPQEQDSVKIAFTKARAYKNSSQPSNPVPNIVQCPLQEPYAGVSLKNGDYPISDELDDGDSDKEVPLALKLALKKAKEYKKNRNVAESEGAVSEIVQNSGVEIDEKNGGQKEVPSAIKLALEKAKEYKKNKDGMGSDALASGFEGGNKNSTGDKKMVKSSEKKDELSISSIDFMGLGFSDKKSGRGLPAGLVPLSDPFPEGDIPEVEMIVGDMSNFDDALAESKPIQTEEDDADLYKPTVSTWGVFPRPNDISKTYGGGKTIRPGEALETAEEKATKQARTRQLLAAYKTKIGLNIDPKLKSECEKALKDGDSLMDLGELKEALPFYEKVMEKLPFQTELHGLAALQWSICQDSLSRANEARSTYEKLQSHPSPKVSKKARQFAFGFQAMEMLKVRSSNPPLSTGYQNYFEAFLQRKTSYQVEESEVEEGGLKQAIPYVIFLVSPIFIVLLLIAASSRSQ